jgi:hypothetical protein
LTPSVTAFTTRLDLAHRELAAAQRAGRELAYRGAQVLALPHRFAPPFLSALRRY